MQLGGLSESVTVSGDASLLRSQTSRSRTGRRQQESRGLPLNGRSFISLAGLAPGVALPPGSSLPRINGGRPRTNEYLFDGISVLQPEPGQVAFFPNVDAIQEFKIESNSPPARIRPLQRRRRQPDDQGGQQRVSRHRLRIPPQRGAERAQFLRVDQFRSSRSFDAISSAAWPVGRSRRTARSSSSTIRDSGRRSAVRDLDGADDSAAPGHLHRGHRHARPVDFRPGDDPRESRRRRHPHPVSRQRDPCRPHRSRRRELLSHYPLPTSAGTANNYRRARQ